MPLMIIVKLDEVNHVLANPPAGHRLVAVCQHRAPDPIEVAENNKKHEECTCRLLVQAYRTSGLRMA